MGIVTFILQPHFVLVTRIYSVNYGIMIQNETDLNDPETL